MLLQPRYSMSEFPFICLQIICQSSDRLTYIILNKLLSLVRVGTDPCTFHYVVSQSHHIRCGHILLELHCLLSFQLLDQLNCTLLDSILCQIIMLQPPMFVFQVILINITFVLVLAQIHLRIPFHLQNSSRYYGQWTQHFHYSLELNTQDLFRWLLPYRIPLVATLAIDLFTPTLALTVVLTVTLSHNMYLIWPTLKLAHFETFPLIGSRIPII